MKVLIADKFEQSGIDGLKAVGCDIVYNPDLKDDTLVDAIRESQADVLVVRSTKVKKPMLEAGMLGLVVRAGAGYDNIDVGTASERGIYVANCPGKNSVAVAELAFGMILALDRRIPDNVADLRAGIWNKKEYSKSRGIHGRTLGLLGFGNIGQEMAKRAQAFGLNIAVWSEIGVEVDRAGLPVDLPLLVRLRPSSGYPVEPRVRVCATPEEVAEIADIVSVHLALNDRTRGLIGKNVFDRMKPGSFFINTARGEVVDYAALEAAVKEKSLRVALDVYAKEPSTGTGEFADPLIHLPNVYGTHHIGASTDQAQEAIAAETVRVVKTYVETGRVLNVVNLSRQTAATHVLVVRHRDEPGVLATVFDALRAEKVNAEETENIVFTGAKACVARINLDAEPSKTLLEKMCNDNPAILDVQLVPLGAPAASYHLARTLMA
ncbi:MAG: D-3-phosphoglycerate dehydrogenase [Acidobacteria bacterium]|jgi:D-3-phosphoglycerate dehydrogenase|nr:D-3-phosphoglycerate dehydrogenase [Acidobacteriota bacterium]